MGTPEKLKTLYLPGENNPDALVQRLHLTTCFALGNELQLNGKSLYHMIKTCSRGLIGGKPHEPNKVEPTELNKFEVEFLDLCDNTKESKDKWHYFNSLMSELVKQNRTALALRLINSLRERNRTAVKTPPEKPKTQEKTIPVRTSLLAEVEKILGPISKKPEPIPKPDAGKK